MHRDTDRVVIVGASLAGATVAKTLRDEGFDGEVTLLGNEPHMPYERPPLSKGVLRGEETLDDAYVNPDPVYAEAGIDMCFGHADRIEFPERRVRLVDGEAIGFDTLVVATGGRPRRPPIPGIDLAGVHTLRTIDDALTIREQMRSTGSVVVVGLGFIGSEVAASLRRSTMDVTAVEPAVTPLAGPLGEAVGGVVEQMHRDHGVRLVLGEGVSRFEGKDTVEQVVTSAGRAIDADLVVVGLGTQPNVEPLVGTPVALSNGVLVDEFGRTAVEDVYAVGDVANHWHPVARRRLRVEHWNNAVKQGRAVARDIVGRGRPYDDVHFFWSEHYGSELQYYGLHEPWDDIVIRGDLATREFLAIYRSEDRVVAAASMGSSRELKVAKQLIASRARLPHARVADEAIDLAAIGADLESAA